ncbi:hypothetical protein [Kineococcus arenarius]|uniref:hypothetical protein n=1 Tax=Kineococcus sp. SYSU DK007 TaxID=3383128 RepID=UPI003D7D74CB
MSESPCPSGPADRHDAAAPEPYRSWLRVEVNTAPLPSQSSPRPGPVTDATDERLAVLRRRVVEPVVRSLLAPQELEALSVHWGVDGEVGDVWVRIDVPGERHEQWLPSPWHESDPAGAGEAAQAPPTEAEVAAQLAHQLEDWVCETSFAWGQQRTARYELPAD